MTPCSIAFACTLFAVAPSAEGANDEPLRVRVHVPSGTHYVGECVDVTVSVLAESERPAISTPRSPEYRLELVGTELQRVSASGIGDLVATQNLFRYRYRLIARRAGVLRVPALTVRAGDATGSSGPIALTFHDPPLAQRPRAFLGGVGPFEVTAEAVPPAIRLGEALEYRIRLSGPAALGSLSIPDLRLPGTVTVQPEVEVLEPEEVAEPPSRLFRFRLRPTRAGECVLPPVPIAAFDPRSARYVTKLAHGVPVRVAEVAQLGESALSYGEDGSGEDDWPGSAALRGRLGYCGVGLIIMALGLLWRVARRSGAMRDRAREAASRRARGVPGEGGPSEVARWVNEGLTEYLTIAVNRPPGALTPPEAEASIGATTGAPELGERAGRLLDACDRVLYGRRTLLAEELASEAVALFRALAEQTPAGAAVRKTGRGSPDREEG